MPTFRDFLPVRSTHSPPIGQATVPQLRYGAPFPYAFGLVVSTPAVYCWILSLVGADSVLPDASEGANEGPGAEGWHESTARVSHPAALETQRHRNGVERHKGAAALFASVRTKFWSPSRLGMCGATCERPQLQLSRGARASMSGVSTCGVYGQPDGSGGAAQGERPRMNPEINRSSTRPGQQLAIESSLNSSQKHQGTLKTELRLRALTNDVNAYLSALGSIVSIPGTWK
ncbi:hypothetical protein DFH08DRAFT_1090408 [Mycena albidolilacea]|uniref:Uncharacterized protein n=1 Tax=Mycena albidolilacea TaxID=1033008 RepID=A0AAD7E6L6_9AGAR|nr:hypothetical protein DFH08DRAFT_1090408 [Mycena albidolilacea]